MKRPTKFAKYTPLIVEWIDSTSHDGWHYDVKTKPLDPIRTLGFFITQTKQALYLASTIDTIGTGTLGNIAIPLGAIQKVGQVAFRQFRS